MCVLGMAAEFRADGIAFNALWPRFGVATSAIEFALADKAELKRCRRPEILADAAYAIFNKPARTCTGNFFIDDQLLYDEGVREFAAYRIDPAAVLRRGMFIQEDSVPPPGSAGDA
jgi:citronellol/citronellal dehydrogenase